MLRVARRQIQVRDDVGVDGDRRRPARFSASMSRVLNFVLGSAARNARARAMRSAGSNRPANSTASRQTIASLFRLRLLASAEAFSRSYTSSGMFFRAKVADVSTTPEWNHSGGGRLGHQPTVTLHDWHFIGKTS